MKENTSDILKHKSVTGAQTLSGLDKNFTRKVFIFLGIVAFSNPVSLLILGILNRLLMYPIKSVFTCYPASPKYTEKYCFKFILPYIKHFPVIVGAFFQGGRIGLICTISSTEKDFSHDDFFYQFARSTRFLQSILGVSSMTYSGILPSSMKKAMIMSDEELTERCELVAGVVKESELVIRERLELPATTPIILLGGKGSVGSKTLNLFLKEGREVHVVDMGDSIPAKLEGAPAILIDVARKGVLESHMHSFWEGLIVLNETYPEPGVEVQRKLRLNKVELFHIAGVKARALPKLPHAYSGGIPCCAMNPAKQVAPLVKKLS